LSEKLTVSSASKSSTPTYDHIITYFKENGEWPTPSHPEFKDLVTYANRQFDRIKKGQVPTFGTHGFSQEIYMQLRKLGYRTASARKANRQKSGEVFDILKLLRENQEVPISLARKVRRFHNKGLMHSQDETELRELGFNL
jgi:hypothetical protein